VLEEFVDAVLEPVEPVGLDFVQVELVLVRQLGLLADLALLEDLAVRGAFRVLLEEGIGSPTDLSGLIVGGTGVDLNALLVFQWNIPLLPVDGLILVLAGLRGDVDDVLELLHEKVVKGTFVVLETLLLVKVRLLLATQDCLAQRKDLAH